MTETGTAFKYHGTGNDFVIVDASEWSVDFEDLAPALCDRHRGIGADGLIIVEREPAAHPRFDATMIIYNADGSRPQMCGNGIRCVARYLVEYQDAPTTLRIWTDAGARTCVVFADERPWEVDVDMGIASVGDAVHCEIEDRTWELVPVDMGNPHAVTFSTVSSALADVVGSKLNAAGSPFSEGVNVEFVAEEGDNRLRVVVYERGVGRTQACGTGACAAAAAAWESGAATEDTVEVVLPGGTLHIRRQGGDVWMRGDAECVFAGKVSADWLEARMGRTEQ